MIKIVGYQFIIFYFVTNDSNSVIDMVFEEKFFLHKNSIYSYMKTKVG